MEEYFDSAYEELTENIAEYYKNTDNSENKDLIKENEYDTDEVRESFTPKRRFWGFMKQSLKSKANVIGGSEASGEIQDSKYGINSKKKYFIYCSASIAVSFILIGASISIALKMPYDEAADEEYINDLRQADDYVELQKEYAGLSKEVSDLNESLKEKEETVEFIDNYDNKKAELSSKIDSQKQEINDITYNINQKQSEIANLDKIISDRAGTIVTLSPGRYVVGKNIAAGKYSVSGAGKLSVASSDNKSKVNTSIGSSAYELILEDGDIVNIEMSAKFTSIN